MKNRQKGLTTVEFAIIGFLFFLLLFGVIEFGRLLFAWNTLTESARRGARIAAVCPPNHSGIKNIAVFNDATTSGNSVALAGLDTSMVFVEYLNIGGFCITPFTQDDTYCPGPPGVPGNFSVPGNFWDIAYVRVRIAGYSHDMIIPGVDLDPINPLPRIFETTLVSESLGIIPQNDSQCFGTPS